MAHSAQRKNSPVSQLASGPGSQPKEKRYRKQQTAKSPAPPPLLNRKDMPGSGNTGGVVIDPPRA